MTLDAEFIKLFTKTNDSHDLLWKIVHINKIHVLWNKFSCDLYALWALSILIDMENCKITSNWWKIDTSRSAHAEKRHVRRSDFSLFQRTRNRLRPLWFRIRFLLINLYVWNIWNDGGGCRKRSSLTVVMDRRDRDIHNRFAYTKR